MFDLRVRVTWTIITAQSLTPVVRMNHTVMTKSINVCTLWYKIYFFESTLFSMKRTLFLDPACLNINRVLRCFVSEKGCQVVERYRCLFILHLAICMIFSSPELKAQFNMCLAVVQTIYNLYIHSFPSKPLSRWRYPLKLAPMKPRTDNSDIDKYVGIL